MLTFEFVPYMEIASLSPDKRIKKILSIVKDDKIVLLEGRLNKDEETELIQRTMENIDNEFKGIELGVIYPSERNKDFFDRLRHAMIRLVLGNREGFTIIGPATIIKEMKRDPNKLQLSTVDKNIKIKKKKKTKNKK
ncbi:DUF2073 domain-containing protein [Candidatus Woesearchaeota archaeon]|nr:DUF2073 domain-containing protein [Candidatus Woesearchaeota archaeon]